MWVGERVCARLMVAVCVCVCVYACARMRVCERVGAGE